VPTHRKSLAEKSRKSVGVMWSPTTNGKRNGSDREIAKKIAKVNRLR